MKCLTNQILDSPRIKEAHPNSFKANTIMEKNQGIITGEKITTLISILLAEKYLIGKGRIGTNMKKNQISTQSCTY